MGAAWKKAALLAVATLLPLGVAEGFFRRQEGTIVFPWDEPGRGFATAPYARGTNRYGFHERDLESVPRPGVRRVVVLGDSLTYGTTTANETWTHAAGDVLGPAWELLNFGHYGYDAEACAATLRYRAAELQPAVVVYASYTNDLILNSIITVGELGYPVWIGSSGALLPGPLRRWSALARAAEGAVLAREVVQTPDIGQWTRHVADMADQARALGADFVIFGLLPHIFAGPFCEAPGSFCPDHLGWFRLQEQAAAEHGWTFISSEPIWKAAPEDSYYPANKDDLEHPGPAGQLVLGRGFAAALRELQAR